MLVGLLVTTCSQPKTSPDAGPQSLTPCTSDAECAAQGLTCDLARLQCVCTGDAMCPASAPYCNVFTGRCVTTVPGGCTEGSCPAGQYCDEAVRTCKPNLGFCGECSADIPCGSGNYCVRNPLFPTDSTTYCASGCGSGGSCPSGNSCENTVTLSGATIKQCVPAERPCGSAASCVADSLAACNGVGGCSDPSQTCDMTLMRCVATHSMCNPGQACDPRTLQCVESCGLDLDGSTTGDEECQTRFQDASFVCINNVCRPSSQCTSDNDCPLDEFCALGPSSGSNVLGNCEPACTTNDQCPLGQLCQMNATTGRQGCQPGCVTNTDCPLTAVCQTGQCHTTDGMGHQHCQVKQVCNFRQSCLNDICVNEPLNCSSNANGCTNGTTVESAVFYACDSCPSGTTATCWTPGSPPRGYTDPPFTCGTQNCACSFYSCLTSCATTDDCPKGFDCSILIDGMRCTPTDAQCCLPGMCQ